MVKRWQVLLALVLLALLSAPIAADENDERMKELSNKKNVGGLAGWAAIGRGILNSALKGYPTEAYSSGSFQYKPLVVWLVPAIVLLAICLLFAVITLCCVCPCFYCCRSCGNCGGSEPKPGGYTRDEIIKAIVVMAVGIALVFSGFVIGLVANMAVNQGVSDLEFSVTETIDDVIDLPDEFRATFGGIVGNVNSTVENVISLVKEVPASVIGSDGDLTILVRNTTNYLREIQGVFDVLLAVGTRVTISVDNIIYTYEELKPKMDNINARVAAYESLQEYQNDEWYSLDFTCAALKDLKPIVVANVTGLFPDFLSLLNDINGINLNDTADMVEQEFQTISANVTAMVDEQFDSARALVNNFVDQAQGYIDDTLNGTFSSVVEQIQSVQDTIQLYVDQYVTPNNRWRYIIMAVLFAFNGLAAAICLIGFFLKNSPLMTCSSVLSFFLIFLFWILCALHLIVAAPTGKLCNIYYKRDLLNAVPADLLNGLLGLENTGNKRAVFDLGNLTILDPHPVEYYVDLFYDGMDYCHDGGNLATFLNLTDAINLSSYVDEFINSTDLNALVSQVNISSLVGNVDFTAGLNLTQVTSYLAYLNEDYVVYVNILEGIAFSPIIRSINNNTIILSAIMNDTTGIKNCFSSATNVSDPDAVANLISVELNSVYNAIMLANNTDIQYINNNITNLRSDLIYFSSFANSTVDLTMEVIDFVGNIANKLIAIGDEFIFTVTNHTIPTGVGMIYTLADEIEGSIVGFTNCSWVADDVLGIINSVCISTVGGLDTVWVTCGFLGLVLFIMIAGITITAKRKIRSDALDQEHPMDDDFYDNRNNMELPPIYSETSEKA